MKKVKESKKYFCYENGNDLIDLYLQSGDIVSHDYCKYIIINIINDKIECVPVKQSMFQINEKNISSIDFSLIKYFNKEDNLKYLSTLEQGILDQLIELYNKYWERKEMICVPQRGSVINILDELYYIYGENGDKWLVYAINKEELEESDIIKINSVRYYTNYLCSEIDKNDDYNVVVIASDDEIEKNKSKKRDYIVKTKNKHSLIEVGDFVIHFKERNKHMLVVISIYEDCYYCLSLNSLRNGVIDIFPLMRDNLVVSDIKSFKGISWIDNNPDFDYKYIEENIPEILDTQKLYLKRKNRQKSSFNK